MELAFHENDSNVAGQFLHFDEHCAVQTEVQPDIEGIGIGKMLGVQVLKIVDSIEQVHFSRAGLPKPAKCKVTSFSVASSSALKYVSITAASVPSVAAQE